MMRFELEKGSKKYNCPACSQKTFVRYVNQNAGGGNLSLDVGRCDRESKCGYHFTPKEYFAVNPTLATEKAAKVGGHRTWTKSGVFHNALTDKNGSRGAYDVPNVPKKTDFIQSDVLLRTLTNYNRNAFVCFLLRLFPENSEAVWQAVKDYLIGTTKDGRTIFWQVDRRRRVRTGKIIAYDTDTGKRRKDIFPNWTHAELKKKKLLKPDFNLKQCFFGTHLLTKNRNAPVAIVEAEKTAVIASLCFPEFVWLAIGSKQSLKPERLKRLGQRKIVLYPDADGFDVWQTAAHAARVVGQAVRVSDLIERCATKREKCEGFDLADYLINLQILKLHEQKEFADIYNAKLERVLADEKLFTDFETILDEQKAIMTVGGLPETQAENCILNFENLREIVLSV